MEQKPYEQMEDDPEYQAWIEEISRQCDCCPNCWDVPCSGVQAGGLCDQHCHCGDLMSEPPFCAGCGGTCECDEYDNEI